MLSVQGAGHPAGFLLPVSFDPGRDMNLEAGQTSFIQRLQERSLNSRIPAGRPIPTPAAPTHLSTQEGQVSASDDVQLLRGLVVLGDGTESTKSPSSRQALCTDRSNDMGETLA